MTGNRRINPDGEHMVVCGIHFLAADYGSVAADKWVKEGLCPDGKKSGACYFTEMMEVEELKDGPK